MTVVVFKNGVMASDSQCTDDDGNVMMNVDKVFELPKGGLIGISGNYDVRNILDIMDEVAGEDTLPSKEELAHTQCDFAGILALPDGTLWDIDIELVSYENTDEWTASVGEITEEHYAVGTGGQLALGALDLGATVEQAVDIAIARNAYCGGARQEGVVKGWAEARKKRNKQ